jgi:hypothetical protein
MQSHKIKKGGNSNLIDWLPPFYIFVRLHCNLLNWSCLPFIFFAIALQSIELELPPLFKKAGPEPRWYGYGETDIITKTLHCNVAA